jgi:hypothetical protein
MTSQAGESEPGTLFDRWQKEQQSWQKLVIDYVDKAATDETFLTNLGNAMRGSLLANKPYPGTSAGGGEARRDAERSELDEVVFAVRRLEGQLLDLTMAVEKLTASLTPTHVSASDQPAAHGTAPTSD